MLRRDSRSRNSTRFTQGKPMVQGKALVQRATEEAEESEDNGAPSEFVRALA